MYLAFVDLKMALDLVGRDGLFKILQKIGCPPINITESFHTNMKNTVCIDG